MQGVKDSEGSVKVTWKNDYVNIPVLAKYYVFNGLNFFAGQQVGFNVHTLSSTADRLFLLVLQLLHFGILIINMNNLLTNKENDYFCN